MATSKNLDPNFDPFPFGWNKSFAPRTDGIILGTNIPTSSLFLPPPDSTTERADVPLNTPGEMQPYIGDTTCISATGIQYPIFAGDD